MSKRISVTRNFDRTDVIGLLTLRDDIEIPPDSVFSLAYSVQERDEHNTPTKIEVSSVSLLQDENFLRYVKHNNPSLFQSVAEEKSA